MEDIVDKIESLLKSAVGYGKTSYELAKLKAIDKTSDVVSSLIPHAVVFFYYDVVPAYSQFSTTTLIAQNSKTIKSFGQFVSHHSFQKRK